MCEYSKLYIQNPTSGYPQSPSHTVCVVWFAARAWPRPAFAPPPRTPRSCVVVVVVREEVVVVLVVVAVGEAGEVVGTNVGSVVLII